jgi:TolB protein
MKLLTFILIGSMLLLTQPLLAKNEDDEKIIVKLATESKLMPLYLAPFYTESAGFDTQYLHQLEDVLLFDLNHNGMTYAVEHTNENNALANPGNFTDTGNSAAWNALNIFYVLKIRVKDKQIDARMLSVNSNSHKALDGLALTGSLQQDRLQIHRLADSIFKALFNADGIANTKILYTIKAGNPKKPTAEVWEADYDGANAHQITNENTLCVNPTYIPPKPGYSSGSIMYVSYKSGQSKIYVASAKEGIGRRFSLLKGNQLMPAISRQRDKVAFICDYTGNPDLFLQAFDPERGLIGKPQQIFSTHQATQGTPTFSPDGNKIAFVSNKDGSPRIYVIDIPTPGASLKDIKATLISKANRDNTAPAWSPDGSKLAYCSAVNGVRQIWIYDVDKRQERQITQGSTNKENPSWAPNSLHLVFNSTGNNSSELYLINLNQPEAIKITKGAGDKRFPSWESRQ